MNVSPDQVRAATRTAAAVITAETMPPLQLDEPSRRHGRARRTRPAWATPLAAAAAVVIVAVGSAAGSSLLGGSGKGRPGQPAATRQGASAAALAGVPPYYVALGNPSLAVVRATATGATLARITTSTPFVGVTGAADDRTFVLDAQRQVMGPTVRWPEQPKFSLLRLSASGTEQSLTPLPLAALPKGAAVTGLALSPDGSKLAVETDKQSGLLSGLLEIRVYTLATGAFRTWSAHGSTDPVDEGGFTGSGVDGSATISWTADSRTLAFDWGNPSLSGVRLLNTAVSGDNLIADSRLAVVEANLKSPVPGRPGPPDYVSQCVTDAIVAPDGSAILCGYATTMGGVTAAAARTTTGFIRYSTSTGKPAQVIGVSTFRGQAGGDISLLWISATGKSLIGGILTPSGIRVGAIHGQTFTLLPGTAGLLEAAW